MLKTRQLIIRFVNALTSMWQTCGQAPQVTYVIFLYNILSILCGNRTRRPTGSIATYYVISEQIYQEQNQHKIYVSFECGTIIQVKYIVRRTQIFVFVHCESFSHFCTLSISVLYERLFLLAIWISRELIIMATAQCKKKMEVMFACCIK